MSTVIDLMLMVRKNRTIFYHKDTNKFDYYYFSKPESKELDPDVWGCLLSAL